MNITLPQSKIERQGYEYGKEFIVERVQNRSFMNRVPQRHGEAAEEMNTLYDLFNFKWARVVGRDNVASGHDRVSNGRMIQVKYYNDTSKLVSEIIENNEIKYKEQFIEVPPERYEEVKNNLKNRIRKGTVVGIDESEVDEIILKGPVSYETAKKVCENTIEGFTWDALESFVYVGLPVFGISALLTYATDIWEGKSQKEALKHAVVAGGKASGSAVVMSTINLQLRRYGAPQKVRPIVDKTIDFIGEDKLDWLKEKGQTSDRFKNELATESIIFLAELAVKTTVDGYKLYKGDVTGTQLSANIVENAFVAISGNIGKRVGKKVGYVTAIAITNYISSTIPGLGVLRGKSKAIGKAGEHVGGFVGQWIGSEIGRFVIRLFLNQVITNDQARIKESKNYFDYCLHLLQEEYLLTNRELERIKTWIAPIESKVNGTKEFNNELGKYNKSYTRASLKMYKSENKVEVALEFFRPIVEKAVAKRQTINIPTEADAMEAMEELEKEWIRNMILEPQKHKEIYIEQKPDISDMVLPKETIYIPTKEEAYEVLNRKVYEPSYNNQLCVNDLYTLEIEKSRKGLWVATLMVDATVLAMVP